MQDAFYSDKLYPFQDKILHLVSTVDSDFYLTGGTALSRHYFHHRFSDDLGFFSNNNPSFQKQTENVIAKIRSHYNVDAQVVTPEFLLIFVESDGIKLKIDFINDVPFRIGDPIKTSLFTRTDNWRNILSNKISALQRNAPKDVADIIEIAKHFDFSWLEIIESAKKKDMWVNELEVARIVGEFDARALKQIKWIKEPDLKATTKLLSEISKDILLGAHNSVKTKM